MIQKRKRLGDLLVDSSVISEKQLMQALHEQKNTGLRLGDQLIEMNLVSEQQIIEVLEFQLGIPHVDLYRQRLDKKLVNIISEDLARKHQILPLKKTNNRLMVAMYDPLDYFALDDLRLSTGFEIDPAIAKKEELRLAISRFYGIQKSIDQMLKEMPFSEEDQDFLESQQSDDSPVAKMVNQLISQAVQLGASDIHIDPFETETLIRLRVDGILRTERTLPKKMNNMLVSRIKIMSSLNIAEKRLPQDGRFNLDLELKTIDLRVSILPTVHGEKVVMRLLDTGSVKLGIERLGFSESNEINFRRMINYPYGIILVTGPTGSGKSTTLYTALNELNSDAVNLITVEDPVEYQIKGINQLQVKPSIGLTFAAGLRSILRQDPDVIMVGEIRDSETAEIALRSAMTGHLVLSTLHTNDSAGAISRLNDMGIEPFLIASSIVGVVAQRLVRKVCPHCSSKYTLSKEEEELFTSRGLKTNGIVKGAGCSYCNSTGYIGRFAIHEMIVVDDHLRQMINIKQSDATYREYVKEQGFKSLLDDGLTKASQGKTTLEEIYRVLSY
ncbi:type II secretion system ATPase GspE [Cytobacillus sp. NCCP-133]|uniref:type II secretion system ATPase GspE n=1 Tax=Cytobacillus sp. NCCP-133 TaxID=766848 RepID=UPI00223268A9|nr:type II secretion system ATPase GspE [Cytobacillus sp. NCCP-133]GLB58375.1 type II secretion system protein E [Cytobacillus sp. NCCP-133]